MAKLTYTDKVALYENPEVADINKVKDSDMNQIKDVVNNTILNSLFGVGTDTWSTSEEYEEGSIVVYDCILYINITGSYTTTNPSLDTTNWEVLPILKEIVE